MQNDFSLIKKQILRKATFIFLFLLLNILILKKLELALGLVLGVGGSYFNFWHLNRTYDKIIDEKMEQKKIAAYAFNKYVFRLAITLIILVIAMKTNQEAFLGAIAGLVIIKLTIFLDNWLELMKIYFNNYLAKIRRR